MQPSGQISFSNPPSQPTPKQQLKVPLETKQQKNTKKLNQTLDNSKVVLFDIKTAIPLDPFPDELVIDANKVSVIHRTFFMSDQILSIPVKDIIEVRAETSPFFSTIKITPTRPTPEQPIQLSYLKTKEAKKARNLIQGLLVADKEQIDLAAVEPTALINKIEELGKAT